MAKPRGVSRVPEENIRTIRSVVRTALMNPDSVKKMFDTLAKIQSSYLAAGRKRLAQLEDYAEEGIQRTGIALTENDWVLAAILEGVALNLIQVRSEMSSLIELLKSDTMPRKEVLAKLEGMKEELSIPQEDKRNIEWMRKFLSHASSVGGEGT